MKRVTFVTCKWCVYSNNIKDAPDKAIPNKKQKYGMCPKCDSRLTVVDWEEVPDC